MRARGWDAVTLLAQGETIPNYHWPTDTYENIAPKHRADPHSRPGASCSRALDAQVSPPEVAGRLQRLGQLAPRAGLRKKASPHHRDGTGGCADASRPATRPGTHVLVLGDVRSRCVAFVCGGPAVRAGRVKPFANRKTRSESPRGLNAGTGTAPSGS